MDEHRRTRPEDKRAGETAEGVRIIDADEAAEAMERDDIAPRRTDDELRYGDRPPAPPEGPRPALRFPLDASADPTRIERPPVQPAPEPVSGPVELPHWTDPPTGEVPAVLIGTETPLLDEDGEDLDAWSSFATTSPRWRDADDDWGDDGFVERLANESDDLRVGALGDRDGEPSHEEYFGFDDLDERVNERTGEAPASEGPRLHVDDDDDVWSASGEGDIAVDDRPERSGDAAAGADDETEDEDRSAGHAGDEDTYDNDLYDDDEEGRNGRNEGGGRDGDDGRDGEEPPTGRNLVQAALVGAGIAVVAIVCLKLGTAVSTVLVTAVMAVCAVEYFGVLRKVGWEAATLLGVAAIVAFPLAVHWRGSPAFGLMAFLSVAAVFVWYLVGAGGPDPRVLEGSGATLLGVGWIGGLGATAAAMLAVPDGRALFLIAILATVAYDVAGLLVGRAIGRRPLTAASPNKTLEGLLAGMGAAFLMTLALVGFADLGPWKTGSAALLLGVGTAVAAPLGDLCQSLLKRDLGVKDMGSLLPGHGGVFDRFDAMLFVLPTVYWLAVFVGHVG